MSWRKSLPRIKQAGAFAWWYVAHRRKVKLNTLDKLHDVLQGEMMLQSIYNKHMIEIMNPEVRQLFKTLVIGKNV